MEIRGLLVGMAAMIGVIIVISFMVYDTDLKARPGREWMI